MFPPSGGSGSLDLHKIQLVSILVTCQKYTVAPEMVMNKSHTNLFGKVTGILPIPRCTLKIEIAPIQLAAFGHLWAAMISLLQSIWFIVLVLCTIHFHTVKKRKTKKPNSFENYTQFVRHYEMPHSRSQTNTQKKYINLVWPFLSRWTSEGCGEKTQP